MRSRATAGAPAFRGCGVADEAGASIERQIAAHRELGWPQIELRSVDGVPLAELPSERAEAVVRAVRDARLETPAICSTIGSWSSSIDAPFERDVRELETLARLAGELGARAIRVMSYPGDGRPESDWRREVVRRLRELAERAEQHGLMLLHENCHGWAGTSAERALDLVESVASPALRLLFDVGNPVAHGYDGVAYLEATAALVEHVHLKDAVRTGPGADDVVFVPPGEGEARVLDCLAVLARAGFAGTLSAEPHVALVYHRGDRPPDGVLTDSYVEYGRRLAELLARHDLGLEPAVEGSATCPR